MPTTSSAAIALANAADASSRPSVDPHATAQNEDADDELTLQTRRSQRLAALAAIVSSVQLPTALRARYLSLLTQADAADVGRQLRTSAVLADASSLAPAIVQAALDRTFAGFGPTQMRYTLDVAQRLQERDAEWRSGKVTYALSRGKTTVTRVQVRRAYRRIYACVDALLAPNDPERAALKVLSHEDHSHDGAVNALNALVRVATALLDRASNEVA